MIDWRENEDRWADRRAQYLKRAGDLDDTDARIVAYSELGYSESGIAKQVELNHSTVRSRAKEIEEQLGERALYALRPDELGIEAPLGGDAQ